MSRRPPAGRKDGNHDEVAQRFRDLGCSVAELPVTGIPGFPDLLVGLIGRTFLVEVKNLDSRYGRGGLNANQTAFARDWRGGVLHVCCSVDEATALVQNWRRS